jgi:hypothetical protein
MVRSYTDKELLERAENTNGFNGFPLGYWILAVRVLHIQGSGFCHGNVWDHEQG